MVAGENGVSGLLAPSVVEEETNRELGYVTALLQIMEAMRAPLIIHQIQKLKHVIKTIAQVSVNSLGTKIVSYLTFGGDII